MKTGCVQTPLFNFVAFCVHTSENKETRQLGLSRIIKRTFLNGGTSDVIFLPYVTGGIRGEGRHGAYKQLITTGFIYIL